MDSNQAQGDEAQIEQVVTEQVDQPEQQPQEATPTSEPRTEEGEQLDEEAVALESSKNPERTKAYIEKLKEENRRLKESSKPHSDYGSSVYDSFRPSQQYQVPSAQGFENLNQTQVDQIASQFIDQEGNVDINGLNNALSNANRQAQAAQAETRALKERIERFEEAQQVREAHSVFPELDPKAENFDPLFYELVSDRLLKNMYAGKQQTLLEAASDIRKAYRPSAAPENLTKVKEEAVAEYQKTQQKRVQGPVASGKGETRTTSSTLDELRERTRRGDDSALDERLRNLGVIKD